MELDVSIPAGQFGANGGGLGGDMLGMGVDWGTVNLSELDGLPMVKRADVMGTLTKLDWDDKEPITVEFHILIDENGKVHPIQILESSHPEFNEELMEFASTVEFSPPTLMGVPVRTQYRWPVLLNPE